MRETDNFEDKILDDLLTDSVKDLYPVEDILAEYQDDLVEPSEEFKANMESMFREEKRKLKRQRRRLMMPKVAASIAIFLVVGVFTINQVPAWREPIYNFLFNTTSDGKKMKVEITEENNKDDFEKYMPKYIPEGFELVEKVHDKNLNQYRFIYKYRKDSFTILITSQSSDFYLDPTDFDKIIYNNHTYYTDKQNKIMWIFNRCSYFIYGELKQQELLKIADSII